ncbi:SRPBCC domain-containing protein [Maribellus sp. CM-23]|nr:SRPBCC domain-containing protein [Maribellus sp. CM-23]
MKQWYFDNIDSFRAEVGAKSRFEVQSGERTFTHLWVVTKVVPFECIQYNWKYAEYPGDSLVTFDLKKDGNETLLVLTATFIEDFPGEIPEFKRESCVAGWQYFIQGRLKTYLELNC